jgi:hypothetical protein
VFKPQFGLIKKKNKWGEFDPREFVSPASESAGNGSSYKIESSNTARSRSFGPMRTNNKEDKTVIRQVTDPSLPETTID